jgi:hypothetical protein
LRLEVLQTSALKLGLPCEHLLLGIRQHAVEPAEYRQRQDDILVMAPPEGIADQIRDAPEETDDSLCVIRFLVWHVRGSRYSTSRKLTAR